ncbi:haloacid dehalogenase [Shewanella sairae]|uniref:Haloacid dehalogenase n=1 Tax=Shewanella sairae TaxID=190310 RepID=A0ABQ4PN16_9GAMM|nr:HAD-IA family hydrolase [Shewanella sairae]MCL1131537.1 HAD-IA family hydrolase [Shewanella sairae]GIU49571.1 haloacid dehalogenase [Shewanella sairae]
MTKAYQIKGVLFDLDGTLADTAPDMVAALNMTLKSHGYDPAAFEQLRASASHGSIAMIKTALPDVDEALIPQLQQSLFSDYEQINGDNCQLFPGLNDILAQLTQRAIPYGVITNKPARFTRPLLNRLGLTAKMPAIVSGDTTLHSKPHTAPMFLGAQQLNISPEHILYLGDAERDLVAAKAAGMVSGLVEWGYIGDNDNTADWPADIRFKNSDALKHFLLDN